MYSKLFLPEAFFQPKMYQIQFRLWLPPTPRWGSLQRSPDSLAGLRELLLRGGEKEGMKGEVTGGEGKDFGVTLTMLETDWHPWMMLFYHNYKPITAKLRYGTCAQLHKSYQLHNKICPAIYIGVDADRES